AKLVDPLEELARIEPELRGEAAGLLPLAASARVQAHAEPDERANRVLLGEGDVVRELEGLLDDDDDPPAELGRAERRAEVVTVLEAVAGDDRLGARTQGDRREELGLAPRLEPEAV